MEIIVREDIVHFNRMEHPFSIQMAGVSYCDGSYHIRRPNSSITCVEYVVEGRGYVRQDGREFVAEKGDVYLLNAKRNHDYYSDAAEPWTKLWINVYGDFATQILDYYKVSNINLFKACPAEDIFTELLTVARSGKPVDDIFDECALIFVRLVQLLARSGGSGSGRSVAAELRSLINNDINFTRSIGDYARELYCTKQYAITAFKAVYGVTPYRYITDRRMIAAENLLKNTSLSVSDIAETLSFCDAHYFSTFFKQRMGVSPLRYRQTGRG